MDTKSKRISGLSEGKIAQTPSKYFSDKEKHLIIQEYTLEFDNTRVYLRGGSTKRHIWKKYTGRKERNMAIYTPSSMKPARHVLWSHKTRLNCSENSSQTRILTKV